MAEYVNKRTNRGAFADQAPFVRLQGISKHFGKVRANHEITLDICTRRGKPRKGRTRDRDSSIKAVQPAEQDSI